MSGIILPSDAFRLGDVVVIPSLNRLVRGSRMDDMEPRVMRVLATLAETPGEVVTRTFLFEVIWPETVVGDEALTRAVSELRKALADGAPDAIETIRGTGYRLVLPVHPLPSAKARTKANVGTAPKTADTHAEPQSRRPVAALALVMSAFALVIAMWAAWPRIASEAPLREEAEPFQLDSTSQYYRPGMSELGVYHDSTTGHYFRFSTLNDKD